MKQIIISVLSLVMILSLSMSIAAKETDDGFISAEEAFAAMEAENYPSGVETEEGVSSLSSAKSGMDASISYDRVAVTYYKQIVDTYNNVPAYYEPKTSGSDFQCSEYITRYYKTVYGSSLKGFKVTTSPKPGDYIYATAEQRGKSYGHYAVIKSVNGSQLTLIEQNWSWYSGSTVYAAKNRVIPYGGQYAGTYTVYTPVVNGGSQNNDSPGSFRDLSTSHWAYDYITALVNLKIINGMGDGTFQPEGSVTRAQFIKMIGTDAINNGNNVPNYTTQRFSDVKSSHWSYTYVNWAQQKGIIKGKTANSFAPEDKITRQEMAQILYNYAMFKGLSLTSGTSNFSDKQKIDSWAGDAVSYMVGSGIMTGKGNNNFAPTANATRAEAATVLYRLLDL